MPGDLALLLGAPALVAAGRRALPPLADRVLLADVARSARRVLRAGGRDPGVRRGAVPPGAGAARRGLRPRRPRPAAGWRDRRAGEGGLAGGDPGGVRGSAAPASTAPTTRWLAADPGGLDGLALLVWGLLDMPPALERLMRRRRRADAGRRVRAGCARGRPRRRSPALRGGWSPRGAARASRCRRVGGAGDGARAGPRGAVHAAVGSGRSSRTGRCGWCRRRTRRGRCGRRRGRVLQWARGGGAVLGDGGRLPARRGVSAAGRGGVHRGRHPGLPARGLAAGRAAAGPPDAGAARPVRRRPVAPVGDGLPDRRLVPGRAARRVRRERAGGPVGLGLAPGGDRRWRRAVGAAARRAAAGPGRR